MWILKNFTDLLGYIQSRSLSSCNSIKTFDFSILYTTIPHSKLKDKLMELVQLCFIKKNGQRRYKYLVLGRDRSYFVKKKNTLILQVTSLKLISSICSSFWLTAYLFSLVDVFFTRQSAYLWVQMCSSSRRLLPLFVWGRLHKEASQEKREDFVISLIASIPLSLK